MKEICEIINTKTSEKQFIQIQLRKEHCQMIAIAEYGVSADQAANFTKIHQLEALAAGLSVEEAVQFTEVWKIMAYSAGVAVEDALKFENAYQIYALVKYGVNVEDALKFDNIYQIDALKTGLSVKESLQYNSISDILYLYFSNFLSGLFTSKDDSAASEVEALDANIELVGSCTPQVTNADQ